MTGAKEKAREEAEDAAESAEQYIEAHTEYETRPRRTATHNVEIARVPVDKPRPAQTAGYVSEAFRADYRVESDTHPFEMKTGYTPGVSLEYAVVEVNDYYHVQIEWDDAIVVEAGDAA